MLCNRLPMDGRSCELLSFVRGEHSAALEMRCGEKWVFIWGGFVVKNSMFDFDVRHRPESETRA
jgi:hypothetical protein